MKRSKLILAAAALALTAVFSACGGKGNDNPGPSPDTSKTVNGGVEINGVVWAECNVDTTGTFAAEPESSGMFYQYNRKTAWPATGIVVNWDSTVPSGDTWDPANDPCPAGWRVPTSDDQLSLLKANVSNEWTTLNGVNGYRFTDTVSGASIFLPAAGDRINSDGTLNNVGSYGYYWASNGYSLNFYDSGFIPYQINNSGTLYGFSVRCVSQ